ncbi:MAG: Holliday junction branch migration protein RuvA [Nitriliruptorales bacterium]
MIAHLRGRLASCRHTRDATVVVVDVHGIGYHLFVPNGAAHRLPSVMEEVELHTSLQVREDSLTLYGFATADARDLFELLIGATGVGPKLGLAALSTHSPEGLLRALVDADLEALMLIPGVGRKLAERLVLELRDKVGSLPQVDEAEGQSTLGEVRLALLELGYTNAEAQRALDNLDASAGGDVPELLRGALRAIAALRSGR